ncbi:PHA/PHB synthase family protein [uncultured Sphingomonas sp.]|uniref:PHA/PHB synthase family protein n=1 Tax=uncultured Sphingomonas sp. TaxID=158754 RepID=UPI0035CB3AD7
MAEQTPPDDSPPPAGDWPQQMLEMQRAAVETGIAALERPGAVPVVPGLTDPAALARARDFWRDGFALWERFLDPVPQQSDAPERDRRFKAVAWREHPGFDLMRRSYDLISAHLLRAVEGIEGIDDAARERLRFAARGMIDAISPANFALTNPEVIAKTIATRGDNLVKGMSHFLGDLARGQLTHVADDAFEVGRNLATTPGQVIHRTPLYELIQYAPATDAVLATPLVIFPPWINRFYILDLTPEKSFIRWAVDQGLTVFMVSWKSADASMADVVWDDYIAAQRDAVDTVRALLDVPAVHAIGYCVAGTTLAATLAVQAAEGQADRVESATFFTAQVDFADAGDLKLFVTDHQLALVKALSADGYLDGRYMAMTFNTLRARDLIWNYVTDNYLLGQDYAAFDLLHWNGDTTNLPGKWHMSYLTDLYRDNRLVQPGALSAGGTPIDLRKVATPTYVQAGREDHIAPAASVWKITEQFAGPIRFVLAGSGHIAGVVNPPASGKYQYWTNGGTPASLDDFVAGATETKGSWWPDWIVWLRGFGEATVAPTGARIPGGGALPAIEAAPGTYVRTR